MRAPQRRLDAGLIADSQQSPERYEFFQLVRLYELAFRGEAGDPVSERIRFRNSLRLGFAPSQVEGIDVSRGPGAAGQDEPGPERVEITPAFMGMLGVHGALPTHYTEQVLHRERHLKDTAGRAFLDLFTNRSVGHFYRAWKKYRLPIQYEMDRRNHFLPLLLSLTGLGMAGLRGRLGAIDDESIARLAGLLRQRPMSAEALQRVLASYFREPVEIEQFVGRWYVLPPAQRSRLGAGPLTLGRDALVGERVWQCNLRIRIRIGPLPRARYLAFLPRGELAGALARLLSLAAGGQLEYEICPILRAADVAPCVLGAATGCRLGHDSFVLTRPAAADRSDLAYLAPFTD